MYRIDKIKTLLKNITSQDSIKDIELITRELNELEKDFKVESSKNSKLQERISRQAAELWVYEEILSNN